jgi:DnaJ-class molecular chaperone
MTQGELFVPDDKPCDACRGSGKRPGAYGHLICLSCKGSGLEKDRPDPNTTSIPY